MIDKLKKRLDTLTGTVIVLAIAAGTMFTAGAAFNGYVKRPADNERAVRENTQLLETHTEILDEQTQLLESHGDELEVVGDRVRQNAQRITHLDQEINLIEIKADEIIRIVEQSRCLTKAQLEGGSWQDCI